MLTVDLLLNPNTRLPQIIAAQLPGGHASSIAGAADGVLQYDSEDESEDSKLMTWGRTACSAFPGPVSGFTVRKLPTEGEKTFMDYIQEAGEKVFEDNSIFVIRTSIAGVGNGTARNAIHPEPAAYISSESFDSVSEVNRTPPSDNSFANSSAMLETSFDTVVTGTTGVDTERRTRKRVREDELISASDDTSDHVHHPHIVDTDLTSIDTSH
jgi:hypothetical protein